MRRPGRTPAQITFDQHAAFAAREAAGKAAPRPRSTADALLEQHEKFAKVQATRDAAIHAESVRKVTDYTKRIRDRFKWDREADQREMEKIAE